MKKTVYTCDYCGRILSDCANNNLPHLHLKGILSYVTFEECRPIEINVVKKESQFCDSSCLVDAIREVLDKCANGE